MTQTTLHPSPEVVKRTYESRTRPGVTYTVTIYPDGDVLCSCPAGRNGRKCWHRDHAVLTSDPKPIDYAANAAKRRPWIEEIPLGGAA